MAYTPPIGGAVGFEFGNVAYIAPMGGAVVFEWVLSGSCAAAIQITPGITAKYGQVAAADISSFLSASVGGVIPYQCLVERKIRIILANTDSTPITGAVAAVCPTSTTITVAGTIKALSSSTIPVKGTVVSPPIFVSRVSGVIPHRCAVISLDSMYGMVASTIEVTSSIVGLISPEISASASISIKGTMVAALGVSAMANNKIALRSQSSAVRGCYGVTHAISNIKASASARHGLAANVAGMCQMKLAGDGSSIGVYRAEIDQSMPLSSAIHARYEKTVDVFVDTSLFVTSRIKRIEVTTDV